MASAHLPRQPLAEEGVSTSVRVCTCTHMRICVYHEQGRYKVFSSQESIAFKDGCKSQEMAAYVYVLVCMCMRLGVGMSVCLCRVFLYVL